MTGVDFISFGMDHDLSNGAMGHLAEGEIHVWRANISGQESPLNGDYGILSDLEKARADRLRIAKARQRFIRSHAILRQILAKYLDRLPPQIEIDNLPGGKPALAEKSVPGSEILRFNLAHSQDWMVVSVSRDFETGIDLEFEDPKVDFKQVSKHYFLTDEQTWLANLPEEAQLAAFYRLWTCKEAVLKADGRGIGQGLGRIHIQFDTDESARGFFAGEGTGQSWLIRSFSPVDGYDAALAFKTRASAAVEPKFSYYHWSG